VNIMVCSRLLYAPRRAPLAANNTRNARALPLLAAPAHARRGCGCSLPHLLPLFRTAHFCCAFSLLRALNAITRLNCACLFCCYATAELGFARLQNYGLIFGHYRRGFAGGHGRPGVCRAVFW